MDQRYAVRLVAVNFVLEPLSSTAMKEPNRMDGSWGGAPPALPHAIASLHTTVVFGVAFLCMGLIAGITIVTNASIKHFASC